MFQDKKLQPSTIDGYRSAIADKLGNFPINISKDENLTCLLDTFHRDRPKSRRTFKTVFLLALGSGKRRSEILFGYIRTSDTSQTGLRCLCTPQLAFYPRTSWLRGPR